MRAAAGFRWVRCRQCREQYEVAANPWNPALGSCVVRVGPGQKCGGLLEPMKNVGPIKPRNAGTLATDDEKNELDQFLSKTDLLGDR